MERLATAREMAVPEQLGFPKELPPPETVPRLLAQLALVRLAANVIVEQNAERLVSLKIEDPQAVPADGGEDGTFVMRVPVTVRLHATLPEVLKVLGALERVSPIIDVRGLRVVPGTGPESLDVELVLARYLVMVTAQETREVEEPPDTGTGRRGRKKRSRSERTPRKDKRESSTR